MRLQNVPNGLSLSYHSQFQPPGRDLSAAGRACRCRGKPPRARRSNFMVPRTSASCNLTVGSWECRQAATGRTRTSPAYLQGTVERRQSDVRYRVEGHARAGAALRGEGSLTITAVTNDASKP